MSKNVIVKQAKIAKVEATPEKICGRGGLFFFLRYIENIHFYSLLETHLGFLKTAVKGLSLYQFMKQLLAHFVNGTDLSMTEFDRRKHDDAYAAVLENASEEMASSHQMKRFFRKFLLLGNWLYRKILLALFLWRLLIEKPKMIILFGDTMVLDNNDAKHRQGVTPTYKKKKAFSRCTCAGDVISSMFCFAKAPTTPIMAMISLKRWLASSSSFAAFMPRISLLFLALIAPF